jgi:hypothetical protein
MKITNIYNYFDCDRKLRKDFNLFVKRVKSEESKVTVDKFLNQVEVGDKVYEFRVLKDLNDVLDSELIHVARFDENSKFSGKLVNTVLKVLQRNYRF